MVRRAAAQPAVRLALSVVIPVYNEPIWIARCVRAVLAGAAGSPWEVQVVVVDDGSTDSTPEVLERLAAEHGIVVVSQPNRGRFAARKAGILRATGDHVLLLDSRVILRPDALPWLAGMFADEPTRRVWNGHVHVVTEGSPYSGFWAGLVAIAWRRYLADPRLSSFGVEEFDAYPKGAGCFLAPRQLLSAATETFTSLYDDDRFSSDDTKLIRWVAGQERIWIAPDFACDYHGRSSLRGFAKHAFFRGGTFVDGYLTTAGAPRRAAVLGVAAAAGLAGIAWKRPGTAAVVAGAVPVAVAGTAHRCGATLAEARSVATLMPVFVPSFGAGVVRGLWRAGSAWRQRSR